MRVERIGLEHHRSITPLGTHAVDDPAGDRNRAGALCFETGQNPEQSRLAATGRAEKRQKLAVGDLQGDIVQDVDGAEALRDAVERDTCDVTAAGERFFVP